MLKQGYKPKKNMMWGLLMLLMLSVLAMAAIRSCSHSRQEPFARTYQKAQGDTLDIAIELNPSIFSVRGDSISGIDYSILIEISEKHNVPMKFHPFVPLKHAMEYLDAGLYDVVVAAIPTTSELKKHFAMTRAVYLDRQILVQLTDSAGRRAVSSAIELGSDTVWVPANSPIRERIANLSDEIGDTIIVESNPSYSAGHLFLLVAMGKIRFAVINEGIAREMSADYPQVDVSTPISFTQFQSWAVRKDNVELLDSLNSWLP